MITMWIYAFILIISGLSLFIFKLVKYRKIPSTLWKPGLAWTRAFIYFIICNLISLIVGVTNTLINQSLTNSFQMQDFTWLILCILCFSYIFFAYWILWARMTLTFERKFYIGIGIIFGLIWGVSTGQILLSFYHLWNKLQIPKWAIYIVSYLSMGLWQYFVHDYFWDVYVSPEHDSPRSIKIKTLFSHIPNVALCLSLLVIYENYWIFIILQSLALIATTIFQKFPPPWVNGNFRAPLTKRGIFGLKRGAGYTENP